MEKIIIQDVPDEIINRLIMKAKLHGHSLQRELHDILSHEAGLTSAEKLALIDSIRAMAQKPFAIDSTQMIREDRDSR